MMARETKEYTGRVNRKQDVFDLEDADALAITTAAQMRTKHQQMAQNRENMQQFLDIRMILCLLE